MVVSTVLLILRSMDNVVLGSSPPSAANISFYRRVSVEQGLHLGPVRTSPKVKKLEPASKLEPRFTEFGALDQKDIKFGHIFIL